MISLKGYDIMRKLTVFAALAGLAFAAPASADVMTTTLSFTGIVNSVQDTYGLFGPVNGQISYGTAFTGTITYNNSGLTTCASGPNPCTYTLTAANAPVETLTIASHTATFTGTAGSLVLNPNGGTSEAITFTLSGASGFNFSSEQFGDGNTFFGPSPNYNFSPSLSFSSVNLSYGTGSGTEGSNGGSINVAFRTLAATSTTLAAASVPEPMSLALLGTSLAGLGLIRRIRNGRC